MNDLPKVGEKYRGADGMTLKIVAVKPPTIFYVFDMPGYWPYPYPMDASIWQTETLTKVEAKQ